MAEVLSGEAARILNISANHVRFSNGPGNSGRAGWGRSGVFNRDEVEQLAIERYRKATAPAMWRKKKRPAMGAG